MTLYKFCGALIPLSFNFSLGWELDLSMSKFALRSSGSSCFYALVLIFDLKLVLDIDFLLM